MKEQQPQAKPSQASPKLWRSSGQGRLRQFHRIIESDIRSPPLRGRRSIINPETKLQNQIIVALCKNGCVARNHTVGQFYTKYGGTVNIGHHGEADIWGHRVSDGRAFYIEVKLPGEYPRDDQDKFLKAMAATGAISGCAHSVEEALEIVKTTLPCL